MKRRGVNIRATSNSYGTGWSNQAFRESLTALSNAGILSVAAAGNNALAVWTELNLPDAPPLDATWICKRALSLSSAQFYRLRQPYPDGGFAVRQISGTAALAER